MAVDLTRLTKLIEIHNDLQMGYARLRAARNKAGTALDAVDRLIADERVAQGV